LGDALWLREWSRLPIINSNAFAMRDQKPVLTKRKLSLPYLL
jgi:hypothetical protein